MYKSTVSVRRGWAGRVGAALVDTGAPIGGGKEVVRDGVDPVALARPVIGAATLGMHPRHRNVSDTYLDALALGDRLPAWAEWLGRAQRRYVLAATGAGSAAAGSGQVERHVDHVAVVDRLGVAHLRLHR